MGCTVELVEIDEFAQFPAMADGDVDATLEVWPSGHAKDRKDYIDKARLGRRRRRARRHRQDRMVHPDVPRRARTPTYATWEGFKDNADDVRDGRDRRQGPVPGRRPERSHLRRGDHRRASAWTSRSSTRDRRPHRSRRSTRRYENQDPILMYFWTPHWAQRQVRPDRGRAPRLHRGVRPDRCRGPGRGVGYDCDYPEDVLYKAFSAELETKAPGGVRVPVGDELDRRRPERDRPGDPGGHRRRARPHRHGSTRTPTRGRAWVPTQLRQRESDGRGRPSGRPRSCGGEP